MDHRKSKVVYIHSDNEFLKEQKKELNEKHLEKYFYPFNNFSDAVEFVEHTISSAPKIPHYIVLDDNIPENRFSNALDKLTGLSHYTDKLEVIVITNDSDINLRNKIMQYSFVSAFLVKPVPEDYIEFLITGDN